MKTKAGMDRMEEALRIAHRQARDDMEPSATWREQVMQEVRATDIAKAPAVPNTAPRLFWRLAWAAATIAVVAVVAGYGRYAVPDAQSLWLCLEDTVGISTMLIGL